MKPRQLMVGLSLLMALACSPTEVPTTTTSVAKRAPSKKASKPPASPTQKASGSPKAGASPASSAKINAKLAAVLKVGRVWVYEGTLKAPGGNITLTNRREVTGHQGREAQVKSTVTVLGSDQVSTTTVDLSASSVLEAFKGPGMVLLEEKLATETITVKAGTYVTTRRSGKRDPDGAAVTEWYSDEVGPVKASTVPRKGSAAWKLLQAGMENAETSLELVSVTP